ncbi:hypothetical protein Tcan_02713 [Toxocara canis]|uniref:Uncharacterized protein n=1 Tax=Toxocara canis TaxID=6265 RepID=A0A0B2V8F4_TOXCA|nr:hypothetical protein Tcan_02713 [Toxocara canis]
MKKHLHEETNCTSLLNLSWVCRRYSSLVGYSLQLLRKDGYMVRPFITVLLTVPKLKHKSADQICREKEGADRYRTVETDLCDIRCGSVDELQEHAIPEADAEHLRKMTIIRQDDLPANAAQQSMPSKDLLDDVTISLFLNAKRLGDGELQARENR